MAAVARSYQLKSLYSQTANTDNYGRTNESRNTHYPKMNLSKRMQQAKVCLQLLRDAVIDKPNQAWSIDITYIPIKRGFLYLIAVIDWYRYSRCVVGWEVDDTLDIRMVINALKKAFEVEDPQILNSAQGCHRKIYLHLQL